MTGLLLLLAVVLLLLAVFWGKKCFKVLRPDQMAIKVFLGKPGKTINSGWHFIFWPFVWLEIFSKKQMVFRFWTDSVVTPKGKVRGYGEVDSAIIDIECAVFAYFDPCNLVKTLERAPGKTADVLGPPLTDYVIDIVRSLGGRAPWRLLMDERYASSQWVLARLIRDIKYPELSPDGDGNIIFWDADEKDSSGNRLRDPKKIITVELEKSSPFEQFGLANVSFSVQNIDFVDENMDQVVAAPEKAKLEKRAAKEKAEADGYTIIKKGEADADARKKMGKAEADAREKMGKADAEARKKMISEIKNNPELEKLRILGEINKDGRIVVLPVDFKDLIK